MGRAIFPFRVNTAGEIRHECIDKALDVQLINSHKYFSINFHIPVRLKARMLVPNRPHEAEAMTLPFCHIWRNFYKKSKFIQVKRAW